MIILFYYVFIIHPCIRPRPLVWLASLNVPTPLIIEFLLVFFSLRCRFLTIFTVIPASLSAPLIYLNPPPGENRSPPQSGTNCFVRFTDPEPNPDKRTLVRTAMLFVCARLADCGVIKVFIVQLCSNCGCREGSLAAHQSCHKSEAGAKWQERLWAQMK